MYTKNIITKFHKIRDGTHYTLIRQKVKKKDIVLLLKNYFVQMNISIYGRQMMKYCGRNEMI